MNLGKLPKWLNDVTSKIKEDGLCEIVPDQVIINECKLGQGMSPHIDCESCFGPRIFSLSLGSKVIMEFTQDSNPTKEILLTPRSLVMRYDEARYNWKHSIPARLKDNGVDREERLNLTFRNVES